MGTDLRAAVRNPVPEKKIFRKRKVDTDGARPLQRGGYKVRKSVEKESVSDESVNEIHENGVVPRKANKSSVSVGSRLTEADFLFTRATSQSPCLHETLTTAAITSKIREAYFISFPIK